MSSPNPVSNHSYFLATPFPTIAVIMVGVMIVGLVSSSFALKRFGQIATMVDKAPIASQIPSPVIADIHTCLSVKVEPWFGTNKLSNQQIAVACISETRQKFHTYPKLAAQLTQLSTEIKSHD